mmetsp:Transcript_13370/g.36764  ORF Transcript_13370/g.36764 Transcript_13370/m.36764 type:complete len:214 (+) Transcript_13370:162-803(+)
MVGGLVPGAKDPLQNSWFQEDHLRQTQGPSPPRSPQCPVHSSPRPRNRPWAPAGREEVEEAWRGSNLFPSYRSQSPRMAHTVQAPKQLRAPSWSGFVHARLLNEREQLTQEKAGPARPCPPRSGLDRPRWTACESLARLAGAIAPVVYEPFWTNHQSASGSRHPTDRPTRGTTDHYRPRSVHPSPTSSTPLGASRRTGAQDLCHRAAHYQRLG